MAPEPDLAFSGSVPTEQVPAFFSSVLAIVRMKDGLIAKVPGFRGRQARVFQPLLVEKLYRSIWHRAPGERRYGVDDAPKEAGPGAVRAVVCIVRILSRTKLRERVAV